MKKNLITLLFMVLFLLVSCGGESEDNEELSDIPDDWDYSNVVDDDNTGDTAADTGTEVPGDTGDTAPADTGDTASGDTSADSGDTGDTGNTAPAEICGNETVEYGERCDSAAPITCSSLNENMTGATYCKPDCSAYDMNSCDKKSWGVLNVRFSTKFILDNAKIGDPSYFAQGALPYAAFNGLYGDKKTVFPAEGAVTSFAVTDYYSGPLGGQKRQLFIKQNPVVGGGTGYPRHELEFSPGVIKSGAEYKINAVSVFDLVDNLLKLVRYRLIDKQNGAECIMAIGYSGSVYITSVFPENADLFDGGAVEVVANNVDFYYPTEVPGLDEENNPEVPAEVLKYPVCTK